MRVTLGPGAFTLNVTRFVAARIRRAPASSDSVGAAHSLAPNQDDKAR
jgi:hypothetical protein